MATKTWFTPVALALVSAVASAAPRATIVIPGDSRRQRQESAAVLQRYVEESTGSRLAVSHQASAEGLQIHVGRSAFVDGLGLRLGELGPDGFVLKRVDERNYVIAGLTEDGTEFGVYDFLERYVGVRWLFPGEWGTDVPRRQRLAAEDGEVRSAPAFFSRQMSGLRGPEQLEWARRNRMRSGIEFHHNLYRVFPPSRYVRTNPEFYPLIGGQRYLPGPKDENWQPNFSAAGTVEEAVRFIKDYFRRHPQQETFSLGVNDGSRFDESPESRARENPAPNYLGRRNVSDNYYRWCNEVVERVLEEFPDRYFGCLAYHYVADPPRFPLNPHIIPFLTYERLRWSDPALRALGESVTKRWQAVAPSLGWYDYAYGQDYCLPRVWPHLMQEYLRFGRDHGVRAHYAELYPNWGEGPKAYVYLRLQWNPDLDVDALLAEWYERAVGPDAAPLLAEYFDFWERYWTQDVHRTSYWSHEGQYLDVHALDYLSMLDPDDLTRCREFLDRCVAKTSTQPQRRRAELLRHTFEFYDLSAAAYRPEVLAARAAIRTPKQAEEMAVELEQGITAGRRRLELAHQRKADPVLSVGTGVLDDPRLRGDLWHANLLWRLLDRAAPDTPTRRTLLGLFGSQASPIRDNVGAVLAIADGRCPQVIANPSFEDGLKPWEDRLDAPGGTVRRVRGRARSGEWSVECEGVRAAGPCISVALPPGTYVAVAHALRAPQERSAAAAPSERHASERPLSRKPPEVSLAVQLRAPGQSFWTQPVRLALPPGEWISMAFPFDVPAVQEGHRISGVYMLALATNLELGERFYFDDLGIYRLPEGLRPRSIPPELNDPT